ncbi:MAG: TRAP transporter small permease [Bryobacteraceae bacterium]
MKRWREFLIKGITVYLPMAGGFLANLGVCAMAILVVFMAVMRYGFNWTPGWGDSMSAFLVVFTVFMGAANTFVEDKHIRILFIYKGLSRKVRLLVDGLSGVVTLFYTAFLIYSTADLALASFRLHSTTADGLSLFPLQVWLPIGLCLFFITVSVFTAERFTTLVRTITGRGEPDGAASNR